MAVMSSSVSGAAPLGERASAAAAAGRSASNGAAAAAGAAAAVLAEADAWGTPMALLLLRGVAAPVLSPLLGALKAEGSPRAVSAAMSGLRLMEDGKGTAAVGAALANWCGASRTPSSSTTRGSTLRGIWLWVRVSTAVTSAVRVPPDCKRRG